VNSLEPRCSEPRRSKPRCLWKSLCVIIGATALKATVPMGISVCEFVGATVLGVTVLAEGFCDASTRAYAAAVYLRVANSNGSVGIHLIAFKSKVAPSKTVSIPNLELCGAVLLVQLVIRLRKLALYEKLSIILW
jgi:hypothetical protein